jgi:hypothetical protein
MPPAACRCAWTTGRSTPPTTSLTRSATGAELRLPAPATMQWRHRTVLPDPQGAGDLGPNLSHRRRGQDGGQRLRRPLQRCLATGAAGLSQPARLPRPSSPAGKLRRMIHPDVRSRADHPAVPTCHSAGRRAQDRSSRAAGPRDSGLCLTGPSTVAFFRQGGSPQPRPTTL